ncbi:GntR family transcriptional regulator [uncultured Litoreibacter sp.]|uniref:GntR family transcriptional regulator n=1 Tax=uncultured Litoreibacter sp. TaxID=1392394 RepID=UPI002618BCAC|nr:GntR family transcriptional regulator [uncultured Litoreibacter sp.]
MAFEIFQRQSQHVVLSRTASLPLWEQLYQHLENLILSDKLAVGSRIPSEPLLCDLFGVSKAVVRHAISALASKGLVVKLPRKGMFVCERPKESGFVTSNVSLFEDMMARGASIDTKTFAFTTEKADPEEQQGLLLGPDDDVVRITRLFRVDGMPITHSVISFPAAKLPGFAHKDIKNRSILAAIKQLYGLKVVRADRWLDAHMPNALICERMELNDPKPLIHIESIGYDQNGERLEYYQAYYDTGAARIRISVAD